MQRWILRISIAPITFFFGVASFVVSHKTPSHNSLPKVQRVCRTEPQVRPYVIDKGYYAMTVEVDEVGSYHGSGPRMNLLVLISSPHDSGPKISKMVLQNVTVLSTTLTETISSREAETRSPVMRVTVQVTPEEAKKLTLAESEGKLQLVMPKSRINN